MRKVTVEWRGVDGYVMLSHHNMIPLSDFREILIRQYGPECASEIVDDKFTTVMEVEDHAVVNYLNYSEQWHGEVVSIGCVGA